MSDVCLRKIVVKKLFNRFSYEIDLENGNDIAIIIAPNGCGKTTIFNLIDFAFDPTAEKLERIINVPFERFSCVLSNGKQVVLERGKLKKKSSRNTARAVAMGAVAAPFAPSVPLFASSLIKKLKTEEVLVCKVIDEKIEQIIISDEMLDPKTGKLVNRYASLVQMDDDEDYRSHYIESRVLLAARNICFKITEMLEKHACRIDVKFISADRLNMKVRRSDIDEVGSYYDRKYQTYDPLKAMQENMKVLYSECDRKYRSLVSEARDRLPKMYLTASDKEAMSYAQFKKEWKQYIDDMDKFSELGLLDATQKVLDSGKLEQAYDQKSVFLSEYLRAFQPTLEPWHEEYERLKLFADIINNRNRITNKVLKYGPEGLIISVDGAKLPLDCLSSGEKNDLIMFYNLIFASNKGALVLIDEPEISLHIEWQEEYLDCLINICDMNSLKAVVATHSPNIVNGHFELYAEKSVLDETR